MRTILLTAVFLVAACGWLDDVHLRNPETGEIAICKGGPTSRKAYLPSRQDRLIEQRGCIEDFKEQGFQRDSRME